MPIPLRDALRALRRSPVFVVMSVLSLGLALALNTTMFGLVDATLRPSFPFDVDRLYGLRALGGNPRLRIAGHEHLRAVRAHGSAIDAVSYATFGVGQVDGPSGQMAFQSIVHVPPDFFSTLGVRPLHGRVFGDGERDAVVISFIAWRRLFQGRPLAERLTLSVEGRGYTVVGVMPRGMHFPWPGSAGGHVWLVGPTVDRAGSDRRVAEYASVFVRAAPGATQAAVQRDVDVVARRLTQALGDPAHPLALEARPARAADEARLSDLHRLLSAAVAVVLVIACANLATLMLARGVTRRREVALRMALGATRGHVMRAVLVESGVLAFGGAALGALLTLWALYVLSVQGVHVVPSLGDVEPVPSWRVFAFMLGAAVLAMLLCATLPAIRMAQTDPAGPLGDGSGTTTARRRERHGLLVVVQVALSMSLLLGTGFLVYSTLEMRGFARQVDGRRLVVGSSWQSVRDLPDSAAGRFWNGVVERARTLPGVEDAAWRHAAGPVASLVLSEEGLAGNHRLNLRSYQVVSPSYLRTLGVRLVAGRDFEPGDQAGLGAVIVDEDAARRLWPGLRSPVGRLLKFGPAESKAPWVRVIGVAKNVRYQLRMAPGIPPEPTIYRVVAADSSRNRDVVVRGAPDDPALRLLLRRQLADAVRTRWARTSSWLEEYDDAVSYYAYLAGLFGAFGAFALALSAAGLYGVLAYMVGRRLREFAVRVALGATAGNVAGIVVRQATVLTLAGVGVGALAALFALLAWVDLVFQAQWTMLVVLLGAELVVFGVAALASTGPARRAARADPMAVIRAN